MTRGFKKNSFQAAATCLLFVALAVTLAASLCADSRAGIAEVSSDEPSHRQARKAMREGKYEKAAQIYERLVAIRSTLISWIRMSQIT